MQKKIKKNHMHELFHSGAYEWYAYSFVEIFTEFKSSDSALLSRGRTRYPAIQICLNELNPFHSRGVVWCFFFFFSNSTPTLWTWMLFNAHCSSFTVWMSQFRSRVPLHSFLVDSRAVSISRNGVSLFLNLAYAYVVTWPHLLARPLARTR